MTTRDAWLQLAEWWDAAKVDEDIGKVTAQPKATGLCATIPLLTFRKLISASQEREMLKVLPEMKPAYCWPTTPEGAKMRADFCREQAENCKRIQGRY